jgi:hypothetical protein
MQLDISDVGGGGEIQKAFDLMQEKDGHLFHFCLKMAGLGRKGLEPPTY